MTEEQREDYLEHLRAGMRRGAAARALGLARATVDGALSEDAEFEAQVREAEADADELIEEALWQAAATGSVPAIALWYQRQGAGRRQEPEGAPARGGGGGGPLDQVLDEWTDSDSSD